MELMINLFYKSVVTTLLLFFVALFIAITPIQFQFSADAKPFIPTSDSQILEKLPLRSGGSVTNELRKLRAELSRNPQDLKLALSIAKCYIELGRAESDPRYLSYAEAALQPWLTNLNPEVLVLRAIIHQSNHDFRGALEDLSKALKEDRGKAQAWVTKAQIHTTCGEYSKAKKNCIPLLRLSNELVFVTCISSATSLSGDAQKSFNLLKRIVDNADYATKEEKLWALTILADIAKRLGDNAACERYFKEAFNLSLSDNYLLSAYNDFLLDQGRYSDVVKLLKDKTKIDGLLLRLTLAEQELKLPALDEHIKDLNERFNASKRRGDSVHLREEAIFTLKLLDEPNKALEFAKKNWNVQKEPLDARILLESAIAVNDKTAAKPVIEFISRNKLEDVQLAKLVEKVKDLRS